jgi:hypothetical protein
MLRVVAATRELNTQNFSLLHARHNKYRSLFPRVSAAIQATVIPAVVVLGTILSKAIQFSISKQTHSVTILFAE